MTAPALDPASLSRSLGVTERDLAWALDEAGIDLDYLSRAVRDGDPHGGHAALATRLSRTHADVFLAVAEDLDLSPQEMATLAERNGLDLRALVERLRGERGPRAVPTAAAAAQEPAARPATLPARFFRYLYLPLLVLGLALVALGGAALAWPALVRQVLWTAFSVLAILSGLFAIAAGLRLALDGPRPRAAAPPERAAPSGSSTRADPAASAAAARRAVEDAWRAFRQASAGERRRPRRPEP